MEQRNSIPAEKTRAADKSIAEAFLGSAYYREAKCLFVYISVGSEPDTSAIIRQALSDEKTVCVPRTHKTGLMDAVPLKTLAGYEQAFKGWPLSFGIPEPPQGMPAADHKSIDLVVVPSLAADRAGYRIGYGGGYYDRFAARFRGEKKRPLFVAIQRAEFVHNNTLPRETHDIPADIIVTETGIIIVKNPVILSFS